MHNWSTAHIWCVRYLTIGRTVRLPVSMGGNLRPPARKLVLEYGVEGSKNRWLMRLARDFRFLAI